MRSEISVGELREQASAVLRHTQISDVRLLSAHAGCSHPTIDGPFEVVTEVGVRGVQRPGAVDCFAKYHVRAVTIEDSEPAGGAEAADRSEGSEPAWQVQVELVGTWSCAQDAPSFEDEYLRSFAFAIGAMTLHPYARSHIQGVVGELGYPPFTLDMITPPTALPDEHSLEFEEEDQPPNGSDSVDAAVDS